MLKRVFKNSAYLLLAQGFTKVVAFFYAIYLLGNLGVENFGLYVVALSYFSLVSSIVDFGASQYLIRESSIHPELLPKLLSNTVLIRLTTASLLFFILSLIFYFTDPNHLRVTLILLGLMATIPQTLALTFDSAFVAKQKLRLSAMGILTLSVVVTFGGVFFISRGWGPMGALIGLILGESFYALVNLVNLFKINVPFSFRVSASSLKEIALGGLPYGVLIVLGLLYFKIDALLLNYLKGDFATGIYGAAYKFLEAVVFVPASFQAALFPIMSSLQSVDSKRVFPLYIKVTTSLFLLSLLVVLGYNLILPPLISSFFPKYLASIDVIRILSITIPFLFMISPQALIFLSNKKFLKSLISFSVFNLLLNIVLNLVLIPRYSYIGAAWVTVISDVVSFTVFFIFLWKKLKPQS